MDFWLRLTGGASASSLAKPAYFTDPQQRLARFKRIHDQLLQLWRSKKYLSNGPTTTENVRTCIEGLRRMLEYEVQAPAPHLCIEFLAASQTYNVVTKIASLSHDESIIRETLELSNILIENEEGNFLEDQHFADSLVALIYALSSSIASLMEVENAMVEVLFGIAAKMRQQPKSLPTWFRPGNRHPEGATSGSAITNSSSRSNNREFPLFYFLLNYVHHEGKVGDFARTGLLYIIETATHSDELERWIVESDLAMLMASGLGALYSQLSRKLILSFPNGSVPAIVAFSGNTSPPPPLGTEMSTSEEFQAHMATFLSYLVFWQDVLEHCTSNDVKQSLLDHFEYLFLRQLLYPSLMESSDTDGGSAVAVLSYLRCILESIDHPELTHLILRYLFALPKGLSEDLSKARPTTLVRRRKSEILISTLATGDQKPSPDLFTLVDLILTNLQSRNQQTVTATLRLISVILRSHHQHALSTLVRINTESSSVQRTILAHDEALDHLLSLAEDVAPHDDLEVSFETHLQDAHSLLEFHACSTSLLALPSMSSLITQPSMEKHTSEKPPLLQAHSISPDDPMLKLLLLSFANFLQNDIETNLSLTQTLSTLASCGFTQLEGWLLSNSENNSQTTIFDTREISGVDNTHEVIVDEHRPSAYGDDNAADTHVLDPVYQNLASASSPVLTVLQSLLDQLEKIRRTIPDFDLYLAERRHIFKVGEEIDNALAEKSNIPGKSEDSKHTSPTRYREAAPMGSIPPRLLSENTSASASRSSSPRGRQLTDPPQSALVGRLSHLQIPPSSSPSGLGSRAYSSSPLRKHSLSSQPPKFANPSLGPADALQQRIKMNPRPVDRRGHVRELGSSESSTVRSESGEPVSRTAEEPPEVSLSHLLTNVIILQEFVLEIAAIVQVRVSLFDEVAFV